MKKTNNFYDKIYRYMFKQKEFIKALVKFAFPEKLFTEIDWSTVKSEKTHFVSKNLKSREADAIYEVQLKNKEKMYLYFLVEFQSTPDKLMALRLYIYIAMFYNELLSKGRINVEVPIVLPVVLYTGDTKWRGSKKLTKLMDQDICQIVRRYVPELEYLLIDKNRYSFEDLKKIKDSVSGILYAEKLTGEDMDYHFSVLRDYFLKGLFKEEQTVMLEYFTAIIRYKFSKEISVESIKPEEVPDMLPTLFDKVEEQALLRGRQEGIEEGIEKGIEKGIMTTAYRMLDEDFPVDVIVRVTGLNKEEIEKLKQKADKKHYH